MQSRLAVVQRAEHLRSPKPRRNRNFFVPGEMVRNSGVYLVTHYNHRCEHKIYLLSPELFPICSICDSRVSFFYRGVASNGSCNGSFPRPNIFGCWETRRA
jgi:hypothetical protein